jgi:hypothetical protein
VVDFFTKTRLVTLPSGGVQVSLGKLRRPPAYSRRSSQLARAWRLVFPHNKPTYKKVDRAPLPKSVSSEILDDKMKLTILVIVAATVASAAK